MSVNFDRIAERYDETRGGVERGAEVAAVIASHIARDGLVLEVGVGTGLVACAVDREVVGIDISAAMLAIARQRGGLRLARADGHALPFTADTFAGGYAVWVFHLVADREAVFAEIRRVLRSGALFVVELTATHGVEGDEIQAVLVDLFRGILGEPADVCGECAASATAAGLELVAVEHRTTEIQQSPAEVATSIESRSSSAFWRVTDEQWAAWVEPALAKLRALSDQTALRPHKLVHNTLVLRA
jgi:ubiquinone/menaquinone biosynthesis C-methylase UbiE